MHDGVPGGEGYRYRMIYPDAKLFVDILEDVTGRAFNGTPSFPQASFSTIRRWRLPSTPPIACWRAVPEHWNRRKAMFRVLAAIFQRYGSTIVVPVDTKERSAVGRARDYLDR